MKISVVIPSYNPTVKLSATLDKLVPQAELIDELIVIIDNSNYLDFGKSLEEKYAALLKIKVISQPNSGRAVARNRGMELSSGDIIVFLDDDMLAENDLIKKHIEYHEKNPGVIISGNGYRNPADATYDFGKFLISVEKKWKKYDTDLHEITLKKFDFTACNMSLPKSIFQKLNGFDSRFSDSEDFDFAIRAINQNIKIIYDSRVLAWHNDWPDIETYIKRQNEYSIAKEKILKIRPEYLAYFPRLQVKEGHEIKKFISRIFRHTVGRWVVSKGNVFEMLPRSIKFPLYRIAIFSYSNINNK